MNTSHPRGGRNSVIAATLAAMILGSYGIRHVAAAGTGQPAMQVAAAPPAATVQPATPYVARGLPDFSDIVAREGPAVVNISISGETQASAPDMPSFRGFPGMPDDSDNGDNPFFQFMPHHRQRVPIHGLGSGFIVSPDGIVLTNAHVVENAKEVTVKLTDKREFHAKVLGFDKPTDIAVLKIDATNLPVVHIGNPANEHVGEWVLAIGSPFGFENSVTAGILSATSRSLPDGGYVPFLQSDAAVNPGNSGGPLFNANGDVIGINSQIFSQSGGYEGISFAIPIDIAMKVEKQIAEHGKVAHGRLGVSIQEVSQQLAASFGLDKPRGALISSVEPGSAADSAGLKAGDVILKFGDKDIGSSSDLPPLVIGQAPGTDVKLVIWREGKTREISVKLGALSLADAGGSASASASESGKLGVAVRPLTPEERQEAHVAQGLLIEEVTGPAEQAGLQAGDIVIAVNGKHVASVDELRAAVKAAGKHVALLVKRDDQQIFVPIDLG